MLFCFELLRKFDTIENGKTLFDCQGGMPRSLFHLCDTKEGLYAGVGFGVRVFDRFNPLGSIVVLLLLLLLSPPPLLPANEGRGGGATIS